MLPHPTNQVAERITELECRAGAAVTVWSPLQSASGQWEALGDGWDEPIIEADPVSFCARLEARLQPMDGR